tara:strand:+ start:111 stop:2426 length:2316 start_codon:yes stop_codon:yes gene_type:complete
MDYKQIIDKLVRELSYRVGVPNIKNKEHQSIMSEILSEWGEFDVKQTIFEFLTEEPRKFKNPILNKTVKYKDKNGNEKEGIIGNLLTSPKDSPGRVAAEKMLPSDGTPERDAINKEVGSQGGGGKKDDTSKKSSDDNTDDTQTTQGSALKPGSDYAKKAKELEDRVNKKKKGNEEPKKVPTIDKSNFDKKDPKKYKDNPDGPTRKAIYDDLNNGNIDVLSEYQDGVSVNRTKRISGAGGKKASEGESKYCAGVDTDFDKWESDNQKAISKKESEIKNRKRSADETRTAAQLKMDVDSPEFNTYLAKREVWTEQKIEENKDTAVFKKDFSGNKKSQSSPLGPYTEWMHAAYDGSRQTQKHIKELDIFDLSKPHKTIQSTGEVDEAVQAHLEDNVNNAKTDEDRKHAEKQLKNWNKYKSYHDTYVLGKDKEGRTTYLGISNKKGDALRDPQNNSTPAKRFKYLKEKFGENIAKGVTSSLDKNIKRVEQVKQTTVKTASTLEVTDEFVKICETPELQSYVQKVRETGKFRDYLKAKGLNPDTISTKEVLVEMNNHAQELLKDGKNPSYGTYGKIAIKIGELAIQDKFKSKYPTINFEDESIKKSIDIKATEKETVKQSHLSFVTDLEQVDSPDGYSNDNPDADNGPHQQGYVGGVLDACHIDSYIDSEDDDGMLIQMGVNSVTPSMIRECVRKRSGFKGDISTPEGREELKSHLRKRCRITAGESSVKIMNDGVEEELFDDTWRTAGESQKVATGFGEGMRECLLDKVRTVDSK